MEFIVIYVYLTRYVGTFFLLSQNINCMCFMVALVLYFEFELCVYAIGEVLQEIMVMLGKTEL